LNNYTFSCQFTFQSPQELWQKGSDGGKDIASITGIEVQCEKSYIKVEVKFDRPFEGMIFSKGHYSAPECIHLEANSGSSVARFEVGLNRCGLTASGNIESNGQPNPAGSYLENTIIVQYDPQVQEVWDQARKLRCTWYDYYEKSVTFRPFQVNMLNAVTANFLGDSLQCWMQIQVGKGPWASEVSGIVKIGQTMTMVLGIKDSENKFDMLVRNCVAHNGKKTPIQLVDEVGCITRPKIMSNFQKIKNFGSSATVVSYAYFQAFKFPDSMNVHFQCVIQVCRFSCPDPSCPTQRNSALTKVQHEFNFRQKRAARSIQNTSVSVPAESLLMVLSPNDVAFNLHGGSNHTTETEMDLDSDYDGHGHQLCIGITNAPGAVLALFTAASLISVIIIVVYCTKISKKRKL
jgi:hypothetical protein